MAETDKPAKAALTKNPLGPTGKTVAEAVERLRTEQNLTFAGLSTRLEAIGRPIPPLGLRKIVAETRRVDADDLVALAVALGVSPVTLLMPVTEDPTQDVIITGTEVTRPAYSAWGWLVGELNLDYRDTGRYTTAIVDALAYQRKARPAWLPTVHPGQVRKMEGTDMSIIDDRVRNASVEAVLRTLEGADDGDD